MAPSSLFGFAIDRGGTFTDIYVQKPDGSSRVLKLLSDDELNYRDAPTEGIRRILEAELNIKIPRDSRVPTENISWIRMGTTVATNALLERKGERIVLLVTKGFKDLLYIGNQNRPNIFDLDIEEPELLYERVYEIDERIILHNDDACELELNLPTDQTVTGEKVIIEKSLDIPNVRQLLMHIVESGIRSIAVVLLHSYKYPNHEKIIGKLASELGFINISLSSDVMPMIKIVPRGFTACADAYLTPKIDDYVKNFKSGFKNDLDGVVVQFMRSDGGLSPVEKFSGSRAILSGPAAGVVGVSLTSYSTETKQPVICFDMGGTSTDVSRYAGSFEHVMETSTAGITIQAPQLDIHTVAAGGGSRLFFRDGLFHVGPESSGASPGPLCYRKNGFLSLTDANLVLGRIIPECFPQTFGVASDQPIDREAALDSMKQITEHANMFYQNNLENRRRPLTIEETALGFIEVANEAMCRAIRSITEARGHDTSQHILACFGGAGGQHACAVAKVLGIKKVFIHRFAGVLSAYGLALADVVHEVQEPVAKVFNEESFGFLQTRLSLLKEKCYKALQGIGFDDKCSYCESFLNLRYSRTNCSLMCSGSEFEEKIELFKTSFETAYKREFGFLLPGRDVIVDDIRIRGVGKSRCAEEIKQSFKTNCTTLHRRTNCECYFKDGLTCKKFVTPVFDLPHLMTGHVIVGPAIIVDVNSTIVVEPLCEATITTDGNVLIHVEGQQTMKIGENVDPIHLSIFSHRFESIAEQMGRMLQRTAISTNIKERLDFSCALFGPEGGLVANAPHIPVHLGGMQITVKYQLQNVDLCEGDVILCNHPKAGGSHLPDLTVITPVYHESSEKPVFFVANRGHHADIGGLVPGSMSPFSTSLDQEGAVFVSFKIVKDHMFQEQELIDRLLSPSQIPGCSGTRNLNDNISDLKAQIAANQKGVDLVCELIKYYTLGVVQAYMSHIQWNAEFVVRKLLMKVGSEKKTKCGEAILKAVDYMDDGTRISLTVKIDEIKGEAIFDFGGTGAEVYSSCNAPYAVVVASVLYCLRCLVGNDIPLNQGCLVPVKIKVPAGTILNPHATAAVVGGNVLTSQRICDVIFRSFNAIAGSQGCMNNVLFGNNKMGGYYETVAGGAGAGPNFNGRSAVHTHMTNTRITDPEILEYRYPVILREFSVRKGSGGNGYNRGGDGCRRCIEFRCPLQLSVLSERRAIAPYGLSGGEDGARGINLLQKKNGRLFNIGGKFSIQVETGDIFDLQTPGGGGYGPMKKNESRREERD